MTKTRNAAGSPTPAASENLSKENFYQDYNLYLDKSKEGIHRVPIRFHRTPEFLPELMKQMDQWCLSGLNKEPLNTAGYRIDVTNSTNFSSFQSAVAAMNRITCNGVGFILTADDNLVVVDVDHCLNELGEFNEIAMELLKILPTYTELSQSKTGLHFIFADNDIPVNFTGKKGVIEIYSSQRYFALTGWKLDEKPADVINLNGMTKQLLESYFPVVDFTPTSDLTKYDYPPVHSDDQVLQSLQNNQKFQQLFYQGDISGYPSQSEADGALMLLLAEATILNAPQMRRSFSQSALGKRDKWINRNWYQNYLISGAINFSAQIHPAITAAFTLVSIADDTQLSDELIEAAAICKNNSTFYKYYDAFRKYCKQNKQPLQITMSDFDNKIKLAENRLEAEKIQSHNKQVEKMEQLTLPVPYDKINWIIPDGYKVNANGIWMMTSSGYKKICNSAIFITQEITHYQTQEIKNQLYVSTTGKGWKHFDWIDTKILNNSSLMSLELASLIPTINSVNCSQLIKYLDEFRKANYSNIQQLTSTNNLGWVDDEFVTPYTSNQYVLETTNNTFAQSLQLKGNFTDWKQIAQLVWNHSSISRFILTMGFAPVLLKPLKVRNFCLYLWAKSMLGKTTMFSLVSSIWGTTDTMVNLGGTLNGFEGGAAERTDFVYIIDEKQQVRDNFDATKLIMKLANGKGDARANKDGSLKPVKTWRTIGLLNGEEPLLDDWSTNGAFTRSITLHATEKIIPDDLTAAIWKNIVDQNCGWAGKIFVESLQSTDFQHLIQQHYDIYNQLKQEFPKHHDDHIQYLALGVIAERLANQFIFQQSDNSLQTARDILSQLEVKSAIDNAENEWEHLVSWISTEIKHFKNNPTGENFDPCYGEYKAECLVIIKSVLAEEFERWSKGRLKIDKVLDDLYTTGYIIGRQRNDRTQVNKIWYSFINGTKNVPTVKIDKKSLTDESDWED